MQFRCIFRAFQGLKRTKIVRKLHQSSYVLHKFGNVRKVYVSKYDDSAISLHFLCVSGPETHEKCKKIAPIVVLCYKNFGNVPKIYVTKYDDSAISLHFSCVSGPETHEKCKKIAPIVVLVTEILGTFWSQV